MCIFHFLGFFLFLDRAHDYWYFWIWLRSTEVQHPVVNLTRRDPFPTEFASIYYTYLQLL